MEANLTASFFKHTTILGMCPNHFASLRIMLKRNRTRFVVRCNRIIQRRHISTGSKTRRPVYLYNHTMSQCFSAASPCNQYWHPVVLSGTITFLQVFTKNILLTPDFYMNIKITNAPS